MKIIQTHPVRDKIMVAWAAKKKVLSRTGQHLNMMFCCYQHISPNGLLEK